VVLMTGCDKTTPACLMAAATVNIPAIVLSGGPMLNGWWKGERAGSGTVVWKAREEHAAGASTTRKFIESRRLRAVDRPLQHHGHRLDHERTGRGARHVAAGCAAIPAPYRERGQIAYETGRARRMVEKI
jgi:dihydroxy-acid dehydratase